LKTLTVVKLNEDDLTEAVGLFLEAKGVMIADADVSFRVDGEDLEGLEGVAIMGAETATGRKKGKGKKRKEGLTKNGTRKSIPGASIELAKAILKSVPKRDFASAREMDLHVKFSRTKGQIKRSLDILVEEGKIETTGSGPGLKYKRL